MNIEIKFRGISKFNGEMVYGDLIHGVAHKEGNVYILPRVKNLAKIPGCHHLDGVEVHLETVGQFTGLTDKNGKEIYEGDIVKAAHYNFNHPDTIKIQKVYFDLSCFNVKSVGNEVINPLQEDRNNVPLFWLQAPSTIEIIGNIHQNPELLK